MDRLAQRLKSLGFEGQIEPLAQDVSTRRYYRLFADRTYVVMEDLSENAIIVQEKFVNVATLLRAHNENAPLIFAQENGLMVLEDFGDESLFARLETEPEGALYWLEHALLLWSRIKEVPSLSLPNYSREIYLEEVGRFDRFYLARLGLPSSSLCTKFEPLIDELLTAPTGFTYVDFHAQNLLLLEGSAFGLIDFQDARAGHPLYDAVSLIHDVRRPETYERRKNLEARAIALSGLEPETGQRHAAILTAQRNIKIIGIFARMVSEGRTLYQRYFPYLWQLVHEACQDEALHEIAEEFKAYDVPNEALIKRLEGQHVA